jgi:hypothetical protein
MGQSIDYRKLELVTQFAGLLEALSDPTIKDTIKAAKEVIEEKKALLGPLTEKANLDALLEREEAKLGERKAKMEELLSQAQVEADKIVASAKAQQQEANLVLSRASALELENKALIDETRKDAAVLKEQKDYLDKAQEELKADQEACSKLQEQLQEKLAKIKQMLGE